MKEVNEEKNLEIGEVISKSELFLEQNKKTIIIALVAVLVVVFAIFGLRKFYFQPRQVEAAEQMFAAENWLAQDQYQLALEGNEEFLGFADVADQYGCTKAGRLAKYYAGICQLNLGNYQEALNYLKSYKGKDTFTKAQAIVLCGDACREMGNLKEAISYYEKASKTNTNFVVTPHALVKAGVAYLADNNAAKALDCFKQVKENYPESTEWRDIDKYIALAENTQN